MASEDVQNAPSSARCGQLSVDAAGSGVAGLPVRSPGTHLHPLLRRSPVRPGRRQ